jgi:hypothetical protein
MKGGGGGKPLMGAELLAGMGAGNVEYDGMYASMTGGVATGAVAYSGSIYGAL